MKLLKASVFALVTAAAATGASANELIVSSVTGSGNSGGMAFDVLSSGTAAGLEVRINMGLAERAKVDTSGCAVALPASHSGSCVFNGKEVVVLVYSTTNELLPAGNIDLGTVYFTGAAISKGQSPSVTSFIAGAPDGTPVSSSVHTDLVDDSRSPIEK